MKLPFQRISYYLLVFVAGICSTCQHRDKEITKIRLSKIQSLKLDSVTAVYIDCSLDFKYYGPVGKSVPGYYAGEIRQPLWDSITKKLEDLKYQTLDTADRNSGQLDGYYYSLTIYWEGGKRRLWRGVEWRDGALNSLLVKITNSFKYVRLHPSPPFEFDNRDNGPLPTPTLRWSKPFPLKFSPHK